MHAVLAAVGSAGDVNPVIGVGRALRARGHRVTMLANDHFSPQIEQAGIEFGSIGARETFAWAFSDPDIWHWSRYWGVVCEKLIGPALLPTFRAIAAAYVPGETVVVANHLAFGGLLAKEKLGAPVSSVIVATTMLRCADAPPLIHPFFWRSGVSAITRLQYWCLDQLASNPPLQAQLAPVRRQLGLPDVRRLMQDWILSADQIIAMFPGWFTPGDRAWPQQTTLAGFPQVDLAEQSQLPESLERFLGDGPAPIAFTPGSAMNFGRSFFTEALQACRELKCRGVFLTAQADAVPSPLPPEICHVPWVPFSRLFPRIRALVQHGGAGTVSLAMAAAIPQLIIPFAHDQFHQAARLKELGVGDWLWQRQCRSPLIADRLRRLIESPEVARRCQEAAERMRQAPCALETACDQIERLAPHRRLSRAG